MKCTECGERTNVVQVVQGDVVYRRRKCPKCNVVSYTEEKECIISTKFYLALSDQRKPKK